MQRYEVFSDEGQLEKSLYDTSYSRELQSAELADAVNVSEPVSHAHLRQPIACKIRTSKTKALWEILTLTFQTQISLNTHICLNSKSSLRCSSHIFSGQ